MLALPSISNNMEMGLSSHHQNVTEVVTVQKVKRTKEPGIRVVGNRIYDSSNWKTCHQCRQKTRDFSASCKNLKNGKPCPIKFCHKCLLNRYGEDAEKVALLSDWKCPKCRGHCNCSFCMKSRGQKPTGQLVHTAKASGFKCVSDMLQVTPPENLESDKVNVVVSSIKEPTLKKEQMITGVDNSSCDKALLSNSVSPIKPITSEKDLVVVLSGEPGKENSLDGNRGLKRDYLKAQKISPEKYMKRKREGLKEISNGTKIDNACRKKNRKRPIICDEVPKEELKRNANDGIKVSSEVSEKEMKVDRNHGIVHGEMDGPEAETWGANDSFLDPGTWVSNDPLFNPSQCDVKEETYEKSWKGRVVIDHDDNGGFKSQAGIAKAPKVRKSNMNPEKEKIEEEVPLPPGTVLTGILDIEFPPEDVGSALQFLEFCRVFRKDLDVKKGEAEAILRELVRKQKLRRAQNTLVVQFHIKLLTLILTDSGNSSPSLTTTSESNYWLKALEDLISGSDLVLKEFPLDWLKKGIGGYYDLDLSKKLHLLNFICDEALGTEKLRSYIDDQNVRFAEEVKEAKSKVAAAKEKEKGLKQKLQDELAKVIIPDGVPLSIAEHHALLSKIKSEAAQAHAEMLEAKGTLPKRKQSSDAVRTEPVFVDGSGQAFWKLKSYKGEYAVLLQEIKMEDAAATAADERWLVYGPEKKDEIDKYITSSCRAKRPKIRKVSDTLPNESSEANQ